MELGVIDPCIKSGFTDPCIKSGVTDPLYGVRDNRSSWESDLDSLQLILYVGVMFHAALCFCNKGHVWEVFLGEQECL